MSKASLQPIVVAGHIVLDMFPPIILKEGQHFADLLIGGQIIEIGPLAISVGGAVPNTGISLHRLGVPIYPMGRISDDFLGRETQRIFEQQGLECSLFTRVKETASYTVALAPPSTDRIFLHYPGPNLAFSSTDIRWEIVEKAGIFHLAYPTFMPMLYANSGKLLIDLLRRVKETGATTSMDMSMLARGSESAGLDWYHILASTMPYIDLMLPSIEEMLFMIKRDVFDDLSAKAGEREVLSMVKPDHIMVLAETLLEMGAGVVALKAGYQGLYIRTSGVDRLSEFGRAVPADKINWANRELWEPGFRPFRIANATGAGDAAVAGFLAAFIRGHSIESTLRYACAVGAENLEAVDGFSGIRSWRETTQLIEEGWEKNPLSIDSPGWSFDKSTGQWIGPQDAHCRYGRKSNI